MTTSIQYIILNLYSTTQHITHPFDVILLVHRQIFWVFVNVAHHKKAQVVPVYLQTIGAENLRGTNTSEGTCCWVGGWVDGHNITNRADIAGPVHVQVLIATLRIGCYGHQLLILATLRDEQLILLQSRERNIHRV